MEDSELTASQSREVQNIRDFLNQDGMEIDFDDEFVSSEIVPPDPDQVEVENAVEVVAQNDEGPNDEALNLTVSQNLEVERAMRDAMDEMDVDFNDDNNADDDDNEHQPNQEEDKNESFHVPTFKRPPFITQLSRFRTEIIFQCFDAHYDVITRQIPRMGLTHDNPNPVIQLFGVTKEGHSVCCHVYGFQPYIYVALPYGFTLKDIGPFKHKLNTRLRVHLANAANEYRMMTPIISVDVCKKNNIIGHNPVGKVTFLKITYAYPELIWKLKNVLESGSFSIDERRGGMLFQVFESNVDFLDRFMVDLNLTGTDWIKIKGAYFRNKDLVQNVVLDMTHENIRQESSCQLELDVSFSNIQSLTHKRDDSEYLHEIASGMRLMSFDIECAGRPGVFPEPEVDPIIQISTIVVSGAPKSEADYAPFIKAIYTLNSCDPIEDVYVKSFDTEEQLIISWCQLLNEIDPDVITGYNIKEFDLSYIISRAVKLNILDDINCLGRIQTTPEEICDRIFQANRMKEATFQKKEYKLIGRVILDLYQVVKKEYKLRSYSLNGISAHFLGDQKEDVPHSIITELFNGTSTTRKRLAVYCVKDALLPVKLIQKLMTLINLIEMSKVSGVLLNRLLTRGQQVKVFNQILRKAATHNVIIPVLNDKKKKELMPSDSDSSKTTEVGYEGATVIEPETGYYQEPISTLDFASLYPSIIIAHNLCYTTLVRTDEEGVIGFENLTVSPDTSAEDQTYFVKSNVKKGLLPLILEELLDARKKAKHELKLEKDPFKKQVLDGKQLALKITANSVYGFTGASEIGILPCLKISKAVTAFGREMIELTRQTIESHYTIEKGFPHDAKVIYGDTDSVMVRFGVSDMKEAIVLGEQAAKLVTKNFIPPIKLEFEKVYCPYLLIAKKRYAGLLFTSPEKYDKLDCKGLETVRRDNCKLVGQVMDKCLRIMMVDKDPDGALNYAKTVISQLLQDEIDLSLLIISNELKKPVGPDSGKCNQAHVQVAFKRQQRDPGSAPKAGERVPYVIISTGNKKSPLYERAEDPLYVLDNNIPIDSSYYLKNQLVGPLTRIFEPYFGEKVANELTNGSHTLKKTIPPLPSSSNSGSLSVMSKYFTRLNTCVGCRSTLTTSNETNQSNAVCKHCVKNVTSLFLTQQDKVAKLETKYHRYWSECQRCQGSLIQEVVCNNCDCPIFYARRRVVIDLEKESKILQRF